MKLKLCAGGNLIKTDWVYDEELRKGQYVDTNVTDLMMTYLFEECTLDTNVTLKDIFLLIDCDREALNSLMGNWLNEIVDEGLNGAPTHYKGEYSPHEIEFIEISKFIEIGKGDSSGISTIVDGQGYILKEDIYHGEWLTHKKGSRISWAIDFSSANSLINIPVKLNHTLEIYCFADKSKETKYEGIQYTLGEIIYNIIWELSFHGGPDTRNDASEKLKSAVDQIKKEL